MNYECKSLSLLVIASLKEEKCAPTKLLLPAARSLHLMNSLEPPKVVNNLSSGLGKGRERGKKKRLPIGYFDRCFLVKKVSSLLRGHLLQGEEKSAQEIVLSS